MIDYVRVQNANAAGSDGAHGQLFLSGSAELTNHEDIQRCVQGARNFKPNGHSASRQSEYDHIVSICKLLKL